MGIHTVKLGAAVAGSQPVSAGAEDQRLHATIHRHCETTTLTLTNHFLLPATVPFLTFLMLLSVRAVALKVADLTTIEASAELDGTRLERAKDSRKNKRARY